MASKCVICGKEFTPYICYGDRQKCCSQECRKIYVKKNQMNYYNSRSAEKKQNYKLLLQKKRNGHVKCKICGEPVYRELYFGEPLPQMHEECVIKDVTQTIIAGGKITRAQQSRLYSRGYTITEIRKEIEELKK